MWTLAELLPTAQEIYSYIVTCATQLTYKAKLAKPKLQPLF